MKKPNRPLRNLSLLAFFAAVMVFSTGCLLFYALNADPDGLPCGGELNNACREGYFCLEGICSKVAEGEIGAACAEDAQCKDGLTCQDIFNEENCPAGAESINCQRAAALDLSGKRCRKICDPNTVPPDCQLGQRCYAAAGDENITGWCQDGTCGLDSDCGVNNTAGGIPNICVFISNKESSGLCNFGCDPLQCNPQGGCVGCPTGEGGCEPIEGLERLGCIQPGNVPHSGACDNNGLYCQAGSWCNIPPGSAQGYCARYCNFPSGAPACNAPETCNQMIPGTTIGFCG
jgi:hypothetical protein